jgi:SAM-dependent methyltransferase
MWLDDVPPGRLLDVGCGDARGLQALIARGWRVEGQEVDPAAAAEARAHGVAVHEGELAALGLPAERFDAVTLNHVIEHVHDPLGLLVECRRLLRPGGILVAVTPNAGSLGHRRFGPAWRGLEPPRHLHVFSTAALGRLAVAAGFSDVSTRSTGANAYTFGAASSMLAARRAGRPLGFVGARVRALGFQVSESLSMMTAPDAGEECILRAAR